MKSEKKVDSSFVIILVVLLTLSIGYNIKLKNQLPNHNIRGTHMTENPDKHNSEYLVFRDGVYYRYKQFNILDKGNYEETNDNIYLLKSDDISKQMYLISGNDKLYLYDEEQDSVLVYSKISNKSIFLNVKIEGDNY